MPLILILRTNICNNRYRSLWIRDRLEALKFIGKKLSRFLNCGRSDWKMRNKIDGLIF